MSQISGEGENGSDVDWQGANNSAWIGPRLARQSNDSEVGQNVRNWPLAAVTLDRVGAAAIGGAADQNVALDSGSPRRSRRGQGDGERVASEHHEGDQPSDRLLAVRAEHFRHVTDRPGRRLHSAAFALPAHS